MIARVLCYLFGLLGVLCTGKPFVKTLIVGAGPGGLLSAHALLSRYKEGQHTYDVTVVEARDLPTQETAGPRSYSLGLNIRGQTAIKHFDVPGRSFGLMHAIQREGVFSESFWLHLGKTKIQIRKPSTKKTNKASPPPTLMIPRNRLVAALCEKAQGLYGDRFQIKFGTRVNSVDIKKRRVILSDGETFNYDLLIGTDGINSEVRHALKKQLPELGESFECEEQVLPGAFKVFSQDLPSGLEPAAIHAMSSTSKDSSGFGLFLIPAPNNKICTLVNWKDEKVPPKVLLETAGLDALKKAIEKDFPLFGEPQRDALEQLQLQSPSIAMTIKCKPYASGNACVLLLGDSAHSTGGTLGQGANSALMDVVALDKSLDKHDDNLYLGLREYSDTQEPEGTSLFKLLQLPPKGFWGVIYQLEQLTRGILSRFMPWIFPKPMQNALSQSLVPFRKIVQQNLLWVWLVTRFPTKK